MSDRIDVIIITGYLGAGKSTLLQHLLRLPEIVTRRPALVINEFAQDGVDGRLFDNAGWPLFEINRGSLFCICTKSDLIDALTRIATIAPGMVLVEATGVAETRDIESILDQPTLVGRFRMQANLCVVDALNFTQVVAFLKAARTQVATADGLIVNKIDLVTEDQLDVLTRLLAEMNPRAPQVRAAHSGVASEFLAQLQHQRTEEALAIAQPEAVFSQSFRFQRAVDRQRFLAALSQLGGRLLRLKGHVLFSDRQQPEFVETICGQLTIKPAIADTAQSAFTAIAFGLADQQLSRAFSDLED